MHNMQDAGFHGPDPVLVCRSRFITLPERALDAFCRRWKILGLRLVGSALRGPFRDVTSSSWTCTTRLGRAAPPSRAKSRCSGRAGSRHAVALEAKPPLVITHAPGHMFITDCRSRARGALAAPGVLIFRQ
jgi:hypothetical protein